jgi:hypothetical protein
MNGKNEEGDWIDFDDVGCYLTELANCELNGREIRNAITATRQLAMFRNQPKRYQHRKHVITVSAKFETYLKVVQGGYSDDHIARSDGVG